MKILFILLFTSGLLAEKVKVTIDSHPIDVIIHINEAHKMISTSDKLTLYLEEGNYTIKAEKHNWETAVETLLVDANKPAKVFFSLKKKKMTDEDKEILAQKDIKKFIRFKRVGEIVEDIKRNLTWQDDHRAKSITKSWTAAKEYCKNLVLDGYDDWRLPNYDELLSIVDYDRDNPSIMPSFKNVLSRSYWFSSEDRLDYSRGWYIFFHSGSSFQDDKSSKFNVRCVRGGR